MQTTIVDSPHRLLRLATGHSLVRGWTVAGIVLGLVLIAAAVLKAWRAASGLPIESPLLTSRWVVIALTEAEFFLGVAMVLGIKPRWTWPLAVLAFTGFATVSFFSGVTSQRSCGCLGGLDVNPWAVFAFDLAALVVLWTWRPSEDEGGLRLPEWALASALGTAYAGGVLGAMWMSP